MRMQNDFVACAFVQCTYFVPATPMLLKYLLLMVRLRFFQSKSNSIALAMGWNDKKSGKNIFTQRIEWKQSFSKPKKWERKKNTQNELAVCCWASTHGSFDCAYVFNCAWICVRLCLCVAPFSTHLNSRQAKRNRKFFAVFNEKIDFFPSCLLLPPSVIVCRRWEKFRFIILLVLINNEQKLAIFFVVDCN